MNIFSFRVQSYKLFSYLCSQKEKNIQIDRETYHIGRYRPRNILWGWQRTSPDAALTLSEAPDRCPRQCDTHLGRRGTDGGL